jgi:hypothetical protein
MERLTKNPVHCTTSGGATSIHDGGGGLPSRAFEKHIDYFSVLGAVAG